MQNKIDEIIYSKLETQAKISKLKQLFINENILVFSDFDDTISSNNCVFYTKIKFLKKLNKLTNFHFIRILKAFMLNKSFLSLLKTKNISWNIVIISRNNHLFLKEFLLSKKEILQENNLKIIWCVWQYNEFKFSSAQKLLFLPEQAIFIWDSFENEVLQWYKNFLNVNEFSYIQKKLVLAKKILILFIFMLKWF